MCCFVGRETVSELWSPPSGERYPLGGEVLPWSPDLVIEKDLKLSEKQVWEKNFQVAFNDIHRGKQDIFQLNVGEEGSGKTKYSVRDAAFMDSRFLKQSDDLPNVPYTFEQFGELRDLFNTDNNYQRRGVAVLFDEANLLLNSKRSRSKETMAVVDIFTQVRAKFGYYVQMNFQSFRMPESYVRNDRAKICRRTKVIFSKSKGIHVPAKADYFVRKKMKKIYKDSKSGAIVFPASPDFSFGMDFSLNHRIYDLIEEKKAKALEELSSKKAGKALSVVRKERLLLDYQLAKIDGEEEKMKMIKMELEKL